MRRAGARRIYTVVHAATAWQLLLPFSHPQVLSGCQAHETKQVYLHVQLCAFPTVPYVSINFLLGKCNTESLNGQVHMASIAFKKFKEHPARYTIYIIIALVLLVLIWLLLFNFGKNTLDGCSTKMHSGWLQNINPSHLPCSDVSVVPSSENVGCSGKANTALTGQAILAVDATREDRVYVAPSTGSLA